MKLQYLKNIVVFFEDFFAFFSSVSIATHFIYLFIENNLKISLLGCSSFFKEVLLKIGFIEEMKTT